MTNNEQLEMFLRVLNFFLQFVPLLVAYLVLITMAKVREVNTIATLTKDEVEEVHRLTNGTKDQLVALTDKAAFARGKESQRLDQIDKDIRG